jgi:DNA protecting protein DprA
LSFFFAIARAVEFPIVRLEICPAVEEPPEALYVQGSAEGIELLAKLPENGLAVVGTRRPQPRAEAFVRRVLLDLRGSGLIIVSGLAMGIDARAHEAALEAGLPTVAFLGCGLGLQYPLENLELRQKILRAGGLLVSEYAPQEVAYPGNFLRRNRLIAGLSKATWVVQAPIQSGALNTAMWAQKHGRTLYATPCFPGDPSFAGNERLFDQREKVRAVWNAVSFGETWLDLSSRLALAARQNTQQAAPGSEVLAEIQQRSAQSGGITTTELLDWGFARGIGPLEIFEQLQKAQECGSVSDQQGVLVAARQQLR